MCLCHILRLNINEFEIISQTYIPYTYYGQLRAEHLYLINNFLRFVDYFELIGYIQGTPRNQHEEKDRKLNRKCAKAVKRQSQKKNSIGSTEYEEANSFVTSLT